MARQTISYVVLERLLAQGKSCSEIARILKVTPSAAWKATKRLRVSVSKDVALRSAPQVVERRIDVLGQLQELNSNAREILSLVMRWQRGEPEALRILESQRRVVVYGEGDNKEEVVTYRMRDPREIALRAMGEVRAQLEFQHKLMASLFDLQAVAEFQRIVIEEIGQVCPETRERIIGRLVQHRALRSSIDLPRPEPIP